MATDVVNGNSKMNGTHDARDSLKVKAVRTRVNSGSRSRDPSRSPNRLDSGRDSPARDVRDVSPGLSRTMRESISVDLSKYTDKEAVKWLIWLAKSDRSKVGDFQENHSTSSFFTVLEKQYGKSNVVKGMEVLLGAVGKWDAAEKVANLRISHSGVKKRRQDKDQITLTVKLKATLPKLIERRNAIENDLRDLVEDDDNELYWDRVTFGGATVRFKMAASFRQRLEMLQDDEWKELGGLPILKYQFQDGEVVTVAEDDRHASDEVSVVTAKYDKRKHKSEAQLLGVVLAQNGVRVVDPLYRQLEVWEDGSFADAFVDTGNDVVKYELVCADDVEDKASISSYNDRNVPVVLISFDKENTETESARLIYHLPWMLPMLLEKLQRKAPPPPPPPKVDIPLIVETPDAYQSSASIELTKEILSEKDVDDNEIASKDGADASSSAASHEDDEMKSVSFAGAQVVVDDSGSFSDDAAAEDGIDAASAEDGIDAASAEDGIDAASAAVLASGAEVTLGEAGLEDSGATAAVEVAEDSVADPQEEQLQFKGSSGNDVGVTPLEANEDSDDTKDMMNWTMHKVILIGDSSVGKTSILSRFSDQVFNSNFISTVGIDFKVKKVKRDKRKVKLQIWDTAGQERYRTITAAFYRGTSAFLVVYDVTQMASFVNVSAWLNQITANTDMGGHVIVLIGNKADLDEARQVPRETAQQLADELGIKYFETSAKTGDNVTELFHHVADVLPTEDEEYENQNSRDTVALGDDQMKMPSSRCKC